MENRYLVANPWGVLLIRCENMEGVREFVKQHIATCQDSYLLLLGKHVKASDYQVKNLEEIPIFTQQNKTKQE